MKNILINIKRYFSNQSTFSQVFSILKQGYRGIVNWRKSRYQRFKKLLWYKKMVNAMATALALFILLLFLIDINFLWLFGSSPSLYSISHPDQNSSSEIISADNQVIGKYFTENRIPVTYGEISPILIKTLIATEDERFYEHFGIDFQGVMAAMKDMAKGNARGASTITQQLVKNMYKTRNQYSKGLFGHIPFVKLLIMKAKEWITAVKIEMAYSKEEILTMYFNTVDFGSNAFGIHTAAKTYFKTTPERLNYEQSATLVGLLKATTTYNPRANPKRSTERRNVVLQNLVKQSILTQEQADSLKKIPMKLDYRVEQTYDGKALHFRAYLSKYLEAWEKETGYDIYADGLKIYVTIDSRLQQYAEEAVDKQMRTVQRRFDNHWGNENPWRDENKVEIVDFVEKIARKTKIYATLKERYKNDADSINKYLNVERQTKVFDYQLGEKDTVFSVMDSIRYMSRFLHCSFIAMEPSNGEVKAWVGDINFPFWQYDKVGQAKRQPGSTFKLFVYTAAMMNGKTPCDRLTDKQTTWDYIENGNPKTWVPRNAEGRYSGYSMTLKHAFARSVNTIAVQLAQETGIPEIIKYAHLLGIKTPLENKPSTCLGSSDVSLLELVNSYGTIINEGLFHEPILVTRIEDRKGNIVYQADRTQKQVIPYETAFLMTEMLKGGMTESGGTTQALWEWDLFNYDTDFGGKTGTSSNYSDAWFVGVSKNLIGGSWVGGEHRSIHFRTGSLGEGSRTALPVFALFMEKVLKDNEFKHYRGRFPTKPKEAISKPYNCRSTVPQDSNFSSSDTLDINMLEEMPLNESIDANPSSAITE
ncbi:MAG: transglycosylase domain-containing protein [Paludibacteraceae bacterium]|nr:transglycosylase domain-containing protein [Paludibacteraceae bacterium]MBP6284362.1 transglycosylase domain-containing protein [Paludibacteraceae bacterium]